jgi:plasmid replication initiation protein
MSKKEDKAPKNTQIVVVEQRNKESREPMSIAMSYLPFNKALEMNIYLSVLNKIVAGNFKDREIFDLTTQVVLKVSELGGERNFPRVNDALKRVTNISISLVHKHGGEVFKTMKPFIDSTHVKNTGKIYVSIHPELLVEYSTMVRLGYSTYKIHQMLALDTFFSKRLFEILSGKCYVNSGVWEVDFNHLKRLLSAESYDAYRFVQRAIEETRLEFAAKDVDIDFTYKLTRGVRGRIEAVRFSVKKLADNGNELEAPMSYAEHKELTAAFEEMPSEDKALAVQALLGKMYTFKHTQTEMILRSPALIKLFYDTHIKIEGNIYKDVAHRTRYMATVLGFGSKKK